MTPSQQCKQIIEDIHALFGDKSVSKEKTMALMEEIAEAAQMNADALRDELRHEEADADLDLNDEDDFDDEDDDLDLDDD